MALERDLFTYRSYIAQNKFLVVLDEIRDNSPDILQPIRMLAEYLSDKPKRESIVGQLDQKLSGSANVENEVLIIVAGIIYQLENDLETAYRILHSVECQETSAMIVDILLKINRVDLAKKKLKEMQDKDDDALLTQLTQAWVNCAVVSMDLIYRVAQNERL